MGSVSPISLRRHSFRHSCLSIADIGLEVNHCGKLFDEVVIKFLEKSQSLTGAKRVLGGLSKRQPAKLKDLWAILGLKVNPEKTRGEAEVQLGYPHLIQATGEVQHYSDGYPHLAKFIDNLNNTIRRAIEQGTQTRDAFIEISLACMEDAVRTVSTQHQVTIQDQYHGNLLVQRSFLTITQVGVASAGALKRGQ